MEIASATLTELAREADRFAPKETGGVLMGAWIGSDRVRITGQIGPGPKARHERTSFVPDYDFQEYAIAEHFRGTGGRETYLGDWHTHPGGASYLSERDCATLSRIANHDEARAPHPIMLLLSEGNPWRVAVWRAGYSGRFRRTLRVEPAVLQTLP